MNEPKFTPGPWKMSQVYTNALPNDEFYISGEGSMLAKVLCGGLNYPEHHANAHLIAAAPDLYAVCAEIRDAFSYFSEWDLPIGFEERLDAALAKARGEA